MESKKKKRKFEVIVRRTPLLLMALYLTLLTALISGGASAKYVSPLENSSDDASVAKFDVSYTPIEMPAQGDVLLFHEYTDGTDEKEYTFKLKNESEVAVKITIKAMEVNSAHDANATPNNPYTQIPFDEIEFTSSDVTQTAADGYQFEFEGEEEATFTMTVKPKGSITEEFHRVTLEFLVVQDD